MNKHYKIILAIVIFVFLSGNVSAFDFDNVGDYDEKEKKMTITNLFGMGDKIADIKLTSNPIQYVESGKDVQIAQLEFFNFDRKYGKALKDMEFYNLYELQEIKRDFVYKYQKVVGTKTYPIWSSCPPDSKNCKSKIIGYREQDVIEWIKFNSISQLPKGKVVVGIFTDVYEGDYVEWVPTYFGVRIPEWAIFTTSGLVAYWDFEETGVITKNGINDVLIDAHFGRSNGTINGTWGRGTTGIVNNAYNASGHNNTIIVPDNSTIELGGNATISGWFNTTAEFANGHTFLRKRSGGNSWSIIRNAAQYQLNLWDSAGGTTTINGGVYASQNWTHIAVTINSSDAVLYINAHRVGSANFSQRIVSDTNATMTFGGDTETSGEVYNGTMDEVGIWNVSLTPSQISNIYNDGAGFGLADDLLITLNSPTNNTYFLGSSQTFNASLSSGNNLTNATLYVWNSDGGVNNKTNISITGTSNQSIITATGFPFGRYNWNVVGCDTDKCDMADGNFTFFQGFEENSQEFATPVSSGTRESFSINMTYNGTYHEAVVGYLVYNNTDYTSAIIGSGNTRIFNVSLTVPTTYSSVDKSFYWKFEFTNGSGFIDRANSTANTQAINPFQIDNCTIYSQRILNFSLYDEDARTILKNGTIEVSCEFLDKDRSAVIGSFNKSYEIKEVAGSNVTTDYEVGVCINITNSTYRMDYNAKYWSNETTYATEHRYIQNVLVNSSTATQVNILYNLLDSQSTTFEIALFGRGLEKISGAVIDVQRRYIPINQFLSVEAPLTDSEGKAIAHLVAEDEVYNFIATRNGELLGSFNNYKVKCQNPTTGDCNIDLNLIQSAPPATNFSGRGNISVSYDWDRDNRKLTLNFFSKDGLTHNVTWYVLRRDNWGNTSICTNGATATSGAFICNVPASHGNWSILAKTYADGIYLGHTSFSLMETVEDIFGGTKVIFAMLMYTTLAFLFIANPAMMIIGAMLGMGFASAFHIVDGGTFIGNASIVLWFIIAGGIILYHMWNKA